MLQDLLVSICNLIVRTHTVNTTDRYSEKEASIWFVQSSRYFLGGLNEFFQQIVVVNYRKKCTMMLLFGFKDIRQAEVKR